MVKILAIKISGLDTHSLLKYHTRAKKSCFNYQIPSNSSLWSFLLVTQLLRRKGCLGETVSKCSLLENTGGAKPHSRGNSGAWQPQRMLIGPKNAAIHPSEGSGPWPEESALSRLARGSAPPAG